MALMGTALALCRVWSSDTDQRAGLFWLITAIGFCVLAISQWYEDRFEVMERALQIEDFNGVLLLLLMPPIVLIALRTKGASRIVKAILLIGCCANAVSTGMNLLNDWATSLPDGTPTTDMALDTSELVFLQLYLGAFAWFAGAEIRSGHS